ncbi:g454 [Coccomyxa elongata]
MPGERHVPVSAPSSTPFTDYVLSRIPDEETQKLFALSFGEHLRRNPDALEIDFDDVFRWLGYDRKDNAVRLLKREIPDGEYLLLTNEEGTGPANRASYLISFNQFEELMIAAQTTQGKKARKFVLFLKRVLQEYLIAEQEAHVQQMVQVATAHEAARANALQIQLESLRAQQQHLYCFKLFDNRYKCGIGLDVDRRIRQHRTTCPSGHLVCSVPITCKAMEKLFESVMKEHGAWIRMEEYEMAGDESEIKSIFAVFARTEELLNTTPLDQYDALLKLLETALGTSAITQPNAPVQPTVAPASPDASPSAVGSDTAHVEMNRDTRPHVTPRPAADPDNSNPPALTKERLQSFIGSHCVKGDNRSVGTVRFRTALANHLGLESGRRHVVKLMKDEGFKVGTARPNGGKPHCCFKGLALASSS